MTKKPTYEALEKRVEFLEKNASELKQVLMNLRKFKTISDKAGHGIVMRDRDGKFIYVNEAYAEMHGYTPVKFPSCFFHHICHFSRVIQ